MGQLETQIIQWTQKYNDQSRILRISEAEKEKISIDLDRLRQEMIQLKKEKTVSEREMHDLRQNSVGNGQMLLPENETTLKLIEVTKSLLQSQHQTQALQSALQQAKEVSFV